jgi:hypothetical protein
MDDRPMTQGDRGALEGFFAELRRVWEEAGPPSYKEFEKLSKRVKGPVDGAAQWLSRSTTQHILAGRRRKPPKWRWVSRFIIVLREAAKEAGVDPARIGDLPEWKQKHEAVRAAMAAPELARAAGEDHTFAPLAKPIRPPDPARTPRKTASFLPDETVLQRDPQLARLLRAIGQDWWHGYRDLVRERLGAYLSLEAAASLIRTYDATLVPDLLQTEAYAAAAIKVASSASSGVIVQRLVELRIHRQQRLVQADGPKLWAIIEEAAVRYRFGKAEPMRAQIRHLIEISQLPNVTLQIILRSTSRHTITPCPITILRFPHRDVPDVVYVEQLTGAIYLPYLGDVSNYRHVLSCLAIEALAPATTTDFLHQILREM